MANFAIALYPQKPKVGLWVGATLHKERLLDACL